MRGDFKGRILEFEDWRGEIFLRVEKKTTLELLMERLFFLKKLSILIINKKTWLAVCIINAGLEWRGNYFWVLKRGLWCSILPFRGRNWYFEHIFFTQLYSPSPLFHNFCIYVLINFRDSKLSSLSNYLLPKIVIYYLLD